MPFRASVSVLEVICMPLRPRLEVGENSMSSQSAAALRPFVEIVETWEPDRMITRALRVASIVLEYLAIRQRPERKIISRLDSQFR